MAEAILDNDEMLDMLRKLEFWGAGFREGVCAARGRRVAPDLVLVASVASTQLAHIS